jgi:hypothetical protein
MFQFTFSGARAVAAATLLGTIVFAGPLWAKQDFAPAPAADRVEARIKELHSKLHVTAAQESQWNKVAEMMRDNAKAMVGLQKDRAQDAKSTNENAIDVLKSYSGVVDAHADGIHKFIPVFQAFYDTLSDDQKKTADALFRSRARTAAKQSQMSKN